MKITRLSSFTGVLVEGLDLNAPRSDAAELELKALFDKEGLVVFRGQDLSKKQLVDAGRPFGGTVTANPGTVYDPEMPGVTVISSRGPFGDVLPDDEEKLIGDLDWHTDQGYWTTPNRGKILYAVQVPAEGGKTGFVDGQVTYQALPAGLRSKIADLHVIQSWNLAESYIARNRAYRIDGKREMRHDRYPDVAYPIVLDHPITGEKILNVPPIYAAGIVEMPDIEGTALLAELVAFVTKPQFQYWHAYEPGDAVLWDNWRFMHASSGTPGRYVRTLWSVTIERGPQIGVVMPAKSSGNEQAV